LVKQGLIFLTNIAKEVSSTKGQIERVKEITSEPGGAIIIGSGVLEYPDSATLLDALFHLASNGNLIFPTFNFGNEAGLLHVGLNLPTDGLDFEGMRETASKEKLDVLYVVDGSIPITGFEKVPHIIYQSPYPSDWLKIASIILPTATFVEDSGTMVNMEYKIRKIVQVVNPPGKAKQDWRIFVEIGKKLGALNEYENFEHIQEDLKQGMPIMVPPTQIPQLASEWNPSYRGAVLGDRIQDLARFLKKLPERDRPLSSESLDDLIERVTEEEGVKEVAQ
jgi:hypothetical protein